VITQIPAETWLSESLKFKVQLIDISAIVYILESEIAGHLTIAGRFVFFSQLPNAKYHGIPDRIDGTADEPTVGDIVGFTLSDLIALTVQHVNHITIQMHDLIPVQRKIKGRTPLKVRFIHYPCAQVKFDTRVLHFAEVGRHRSEPYNIGQFTVDQQVQGV